MGVPQGFAWGGAAASYQIEGTAFADGKGLSIRGQFTHAPGWIVIDFHSDGSFYPIIPDLIEIGLDVLNPIQPASMDPVRLKREHGDRLCFWGSIDEQHTLPFGSPEDVQAEVQTRLETLGENGGLIISPTHSVQLDTPLENFWALVEAIRETPYPRGG